MPRPALHRVVSILFLAVLAGSTSSASREVSGRVLDAAGQPLAAATVHLIADAGGADVLAQAEGRQRAAAIATARSDADGLFRLEAPVATALDGEVAVSYPGHLTMRHWLLPGFHPLHLGDVRLPAAERQTIAVVDAAGRPAAGALVVTRPGMERQSTTAGFWHPASAWGWTDARGRVRLPTAGGEDVVWATGAMGWRRPERGPPPDEPLRLAPVRPARVEGDAQGVVVGLANLTVFGSAAGSVAVPAEVESRWGEVGLWTGDGIRKLRREEPAEADAPLRLVIEPATRSSLAVRVTDAATGEAIAGARLFARGETKAETDAEGRATLAVASPDQEILVVAHGYLPWVPAPWRGGDPHHEPSPVGSGGAIEIEARLHPAVTIAGEVRAATGEGEAVAGALVVAAPLRADFGTGAGDPSRGSHAPLVTRTAGDGSFLLPGSDPRVAYRLRITAAGHAPLVHRLAPAGDAPAPLSLALDPALRIRSTVVDEAGMGVPGAEIELRARVEEALRALNASWSGVRAEEWRSTTDSTGGFVIEDLAAGDYELWVEAEGFAGGGRELLVEATGVDRELEPLVLGRGLTLVGRVVDAEDRPLPGSRVAVGPLDRRRHRQAAHAETTTDVDGRFRVAGLGPTSEYSFWVEHETGEVLRILPAPLPEEPLRIVVEARHPLAGVVVDAAGTPVADAWVTLAYGEGGARRASSTTTGSDGTFDYRLPPGPVTVTAAAEEGRSRPRRVLLGEGAAEPLRLVLEVMPASLAGRVVDSAGRGVPGIEVFVNDLDGAGMPQEGSLRVSGEQGELSAARLAPGRYRVGTHGGPPGSAVEVELTAGERREVELTVAGAPVPLAGRVIDALGRPIAGAEVHALRSTGGNGGESRSLTDGAGRFSLRVAPGMEYQVEVLHESYATLVAPVGEAPRDDVELILEPGAVIVGRLLGWTPEALARLTVVAVRDNDSHRGVVLPDGRYRVERLAPGQWVLAAEATGLARVAAEVEVSYPGEELTADLVAPGDRELRGQVLRQGEEVAEAWIRIECGNVHAMTTTHPGGAFVIGGLPSGAACELSVVERGEAAWAVRRVTELENDVRVEILAVPVSGVVHDRETGEPIPGADVSLHARDSSGSASGRRVAGPSGAFSFQAVSPGRYLVSVQAPGYHPVRTEVVLGEGSRLDVQLDPLP